jgi:acyl-CoA thioester hydrolase
VTHEKRIEVRWRDVDALRHVNNAVYATYLEECRDEWADMVLGPVADPWDFVMARVAIDFRNEVRQEDDAVIVRTTLVRVGTSSYTVKEEIRKLDGTLAAEAESVIVARDGEPGRSRPLSDAERSALEAALAA